MKTLLALIALLVSTGCSNMRTPAKERSTAFSIELPHNVLRFSLPDEVVQILSPLSLEKKINPAIDKFYARDNFRVLGSKSYFYYGPFWVGMIGSFRFEFLVVRKDPKYLFEISSLEGLEHYLRQWRKDANASKWSSVSLSGRRWITVSQNSDMFGRPTDDPQSYQCLSCPVDSEMFLEAVFTINEHVAGTAKDWNDHARKMREIILSSLVFEAL